MQSHTSLVLEAMPFLSALSVSTVLLPSCHVLQPQVVGNCRQNHPSHSLVHVCSYHLTDNKKTQMRMKRLNFVVYRVVEDNDEIKALKKEVETFGSSFEMPGFDIGNQSTTNGFH